MEIFNTKILNNRQRWNRALIYGIIATAISVLVCSLAQRFLIRSSIFYFLAAYFISWVILESGHGVQKKFSILAASCMVVTIILSEMFAFFGLSALFNPFGALYYVVIDTLSIDFNSLLSLLIKVYAVYMAYGKARVL